ncbi:MAG: class I tRNA ligase family protein [bacterium]
MSNLNEPKKSESVQEREERILGFWNENDIFKKTLKKDAPKGEFVFYDGPPFATGLPHYGHILTGTIKDVIPRYKTMCGYNVPRQWGWDCHGLPIENLIEKELGLATKKDIETLGIDKFNQAAKESVLRYEGDWKKIVPRVGRFVDMENDYKTMDSNFTESVWWVFKTLYDKGLIYLGYKSMHICPRCETTLANFEVTQGYKDITDLSVTAKFELVDEPGTFVLAWTTTPWTLPGNVALAVGKDIDYVKVLIGEEKFILAKERLSAIPGEYKIIEEFKGSDLVGKSYKPIFDYYSKDVTLENHKNGWKIYDAGFVTTDGGVGVVHIAPAFGDDDMKLGREKKLPFVQHVGMDGKFKSEVLDFVGISVKPKEDHQSTDVLIIKYLAGKKLLFSKEKITHSYPLCWRCDTPLLNYATSSWFLDVTAIKDKMIANNKKINWVPENLRDGRFGKWLEGAQDWAISRTRYWGAPLPVWKCESCEKLEVVGSVADVKNGVEGSVNVYFAMRHGEAESNISGVLSSEKFQKNNHLTEKGRKMVENTALKLKEEGIDLIVSSDYTRTKETSEIVAESVGIKLENIIFDKRLREIQVGDLDGLKIHEYRNHFSSIGEMFLKKAPNGENHTDTKRRVTEVLFDLDSKFKGKKILIVSHGDPLWVLIAGSQGMNVKQTLELESEVDFVNAECRKIDFKQFPHNADYELDLHKPFIDEVRFKCDCGGKMNRISEVFDCWYESGSMPYGQAHYPFENKEAFEKNFPAQFIAEGLDQTRGWFYSLMVLSTALFDKPAFQNVVVNGLILAEDGQKMSKRLKNYPDIMEVVNKYGADALRYYLLSSPVVRAEDLRFSEAGVDEVYKKVILRLYNVYAFFETYKGDGKIKTQNKKPESGNVLDKWILARLAELSQEITVSMERYELDRATRPIEDFVDDFSTWYLRRSRDRFKGDNMDDKDSALNTISFVFNQLAILMAPFMPFTAEDLYQKLSNEINLSSVHLEIWPEVKNEDGSILKLMKSVRGLVSLGLEARMKAGVKVRQPLSKITIKNKELEGVGEYLELIKDELNIKNISFDNNQELDVVLDVVLTEELKEEGNLRELARNIQELRKKSGMSPTDKVLIKISTSEIGNKFIEKFKNEIMKLAGAKEIEFSGGDAGEKIKVGEIEFMVSVGL